MYKLFPIIDVIFTSFLQGIISSLCFLSFVDLQFLKKDIIGGSTYTNKFDAITILKKANKFLIQNIVPFIVTTDTLLT
jgi:hypothetical protein